MCVCGSGFENVCVLILNRCVWFVGTGGGVGGWGAPATLLAATWICASPDEGCVYYLYNELSDGISLYSMWVPFKANWLWKLFASLRLMPLALRNSPSPPPPTFPVKEINKERNSGRKNTIEGAALKPGRRKRN